jgi:simple sugar transport system permease protein
LDARSSSILIHSTRRCSRVLFAFTDAVQIRLEGVPLPLIGPVPTQAVQALPYLATVLLLAAAPRAIGQPYVKER